MKILIHSFIFFLLAIAPYMLNAQKSSSKEITYKIGSPYPVIDALSKDYFEQDGTIITVKVRKKDIVIQKLDAATLKFKSVRNYDDMDKNAVTEALIKVQDRLYFFYSLWDKPKETEQLFYREIDFNKGTFIGEGKLALKVKGKVTGTLARTGFSFAYIGGINVVDKFEVSTSADESKVLIQYRKKPEKRNDDISYDVIGFHVLDQNLEKIWAKDKKMPYTEKKMNNIDYAVDGFGNAFMLTTVYLDNTTKRFKKNGSCNYRMEVLKIDASTQELTKTKISLKDNFINGVWMYEASKGEIICAGFYNDDGRDGSDAKGIFTTKIKSDGSLEPLKTYEIPLEVLNQYASKRTQSKNKKAKKKDKSDFQDLVFRRLLTNEDGSVVIIGEQHYIITRTSTSNGRTTTTYQYFYNDILITKINSDGSLAYMRKLPKRQLGGRGKGGMSFQHFYKENNHYLLFLDNVKNLDAPIDERLPGVHADGAGGYLTAYKVNDSTGDVKKISILNVRDVPQVSSKQLYQFSVNRILNLSDNEFVVEFYKKKKEDVLVKFTIN